MASTKDNKQKKERSSAETKWLQRARAEPVTVQYLMKTLQELQSEHEALKRELLNQGESPLVGSELHCSSQESQY